MKSLLNSSSKCFQRNLIELILLQTLTERNQKNAEKEQNVDLHQKLLLVLASHEKENKNKTHFIEIISEVIVDNRVKAIKLLQTEVIYISRYQEN